MNEKRPMRRWSASSARLAIARDLREIEQLAVELHWQAYATTSDGEPLGDRMLGGEALNMASPAADLTAWEDEYDSLERWAYENDKPLSSAYGGANYADDQAEGHPLIVLQFWTRVVREERGQPTDLKPTLSREVDYLRGSIDWMTRTDDMGEPLWFEVIEVQSDLRSLVRRMEELLSVGSRIDTTATACFNLVGPDLTPCGGQLVRRTLRRRTCEHISLARQIAGWLDVTETDALRGMLAYKPDMSTAHRSCDQGGRDDVYRCLDCERAYTAADYWLAVRQGYERQAGA